MSTLKVTNLETATGGGVAAKLTSINGHAIGGRRRLNINGDFKVQQRGTTSSVTSAKYGIDRMKLEVGSCGTWTLSQDTDVPAGKGFSNSYKIDCTSADASPAAADFLDTRHAMEGQDLQHLKWGTSDAESLTVSFWIKCKKTGTFNLNLISHGASANRGTSKVITISSQDTWEEKSVTFPGDTAQAIPNDNSRGLTLAFWLDAGSDYKGGTSPTSGWETLTSANRAASTTIALADNTNNYMNITGLQMEVGAFQTAYEFWSYGEELSRAQRYFYLAASGADSANATVAICFNYGSGSARAMIYFPTTMRTIPDIFEVSGTNYWRILQHGGTDDHPDSVHGGNERLNMAETSFEDDVSGMTAGDASLLRIDNAAARLGYDAELS
jgi:hypothetical protein